MSITTAVWLFACLFGLSQAVTIFNNVPRLDVNGNIIDCHSGIIVYQNNTYFMYGFGEATVPVLHVYTSPDMQAWTPHGAMLKNAPNGTYFQPWVIYNQKTKMFVVWFNAYPHGCCDGSFGVAQSADGILFDIVTLDETPLYPQVDGNSLLVDDDGNAYVFYSSIVEDHQVSIELLTPDYLHTTQQNYGFFPDHYVEGQILFKRNSTYYAAYGSCCCFCREGSGFSIFSAQSIKGPWTRLGVDKNCDTTTTEVCGEYGERLTGGLIINAQGTGINVIPTKDGNAYIWSAERWLSAAFNNPNCTNECVPQNAANNCTQSGEYIKGNGYSYWYPLNFTETGDINQFASFVNEFELNLVN